LTLVLGLVVTALRKHHCKQVIAVEPDPVAFAILQRTEHGWLLHKACISDKPGVVKLGSGFLGASTTRFNPNAGSGIGPWEAGQDFEIEAITLRELVKDLPDPLFIKIDVEGAEERIFRDVALFAERAPVVLVELHPWWWENPTQAQVDFQTVRSLYDNPTQVFHNTWVLCD
jgi:FkbM family methyltransferase